MCSRCTLFHDIGTRDFRDVLDMTVFVAVLICWIPFGFFVKFWGAKVSMHSWRGHALNTVRVLFRCVC